MTQTFPAGGVQRKEKKEEKEDWGDERKMAPGTVASALPGALRDVRKLKGVC